MKTWFFSNSPLCIFTFITSHHLSVWKSMKLVQIEFRYLNTVANSHLQKKKKNTSPSVLHLICFHLLNVFSSCTCAKYVCPCLTLLSLEAVNFICWLMAPLNSFPELSVSPRSFLPPLRQRSSHCCVCYLRNYIFGELFCGRMFFFSWLHYERCNGQLFVWWVIEAACSSCAKISIKDFIYEPFDILVKNWQAKQYSDCVLLIIFSHWRKNSQPCRCIWIKIL